MICIPPRFDGLTDMRLRTGSTIWNSALRLLEVESLAAPAQFYGPIATTRCIGASRGHDGSHGHHASLRRVGVTGPRKGLCHRLAVASPRPVGRSFLARGRAPPARPVVLLHDNTVRVRRVGGMACVFSWCSFCLSFFRVSWFAQTSLQRASSSCGRCYTIAVAAALVAPGGTLPKVRDSSVEYSVAKRCWWPVVLLGTRLALVSQLAVRLIRRKLQ